jgi:ATP-binding cassette subfamily B protein
MWKVIANMKTKKQTAKRPNTLKNNFYMLKKIAGISPWRVFHAFLTQILERAQWAFFTVVFMRYLFGADDITRTFGDVAVFLSVTAAVMFLFSAYNSWFNNVYVLRTDQTVAFALNRELFDKATTVDISCYENPEFYEQYTKAATEVYERAQSVLYNCSNFVSTLLSSAFVICTIMGINLIAGVFAAVSFVGSFVFGRVLNKLRYDMDMESVPHRRRMAYVSRVVYLQQYAKEMRLSNIFNVMKKIYGEAFDGVIKLVGKYWKKLFVLGETRMFACFTLPFQGMWLFASYLAMVKKTISTGDFIVLSGAIVSTTWMLFGVVDGIVEGIKNAKYIENFKTFMAYIPKIDENQAGLPVKGADVLELRNVSFRYTETGREILRNVSMSVKAGEKIVLVGHNGAGKTTLVKLIMRLYDPTRGQILLNGIDIKEYDLPGYRAQIGAAFQDFQMFSLSAAENVIMSRVNTPSDRKRAADAMKQSGVYEKIATLKHKEDTILTREFDDAGAVLSGGEYQKVATARAFAKDARLVILDEPSSALDPGAEHMMYETIMRLCSGQKNENKIAVIISHRLSSALGADRVYMLENGELIEHGPHKELLARGGAYAQMYNTQAKAYLVDEVEYGS